MLDEFLDSSCWSKSNSKTALRKVDDNHDDYFHLTWNKVDMLVSSGEFETVHLTYLVAHT